MQEPAHRWSRKRHRHGDRHRQHLHLHFSTITGSGFVCGATIQCSTSTESPLATTVFVSATELQATYNTSPAGTTQPSALRSAIPTLAAATSAAVLPTCSSPLPRRSRLTAAARILDQTSFGPTLSRRSPACVPGSALNVYLHPAVRRTCNPPDRWCKSRRPLPGALHLPINSAYPCERVLLLAELPSPAPTSFASAWRLRSV